MPEPLLHFAIPFSIAAPILGLRKAFLVGLIALIPDLDAAVGIHRSVTHSLVILTLFSIAPLILIARLQPRSLDVAFASYLGMVSHLLMDLFQTYTPILYPLTNHSLWIDVNGIIRISQETLATQLEATLKTEPTTFTRFTELDAPLFTSQGLIISLILITIPTLTAALKTTAPANKVGRGSPPRK